MSALPGRAQSGAAAQPRARQGSYRRDLGRRSTRHDSPPRRRPGLSCLGGTWGPTPSLRSASPALSIESRSRVRFFPRDFFARSVSIRCTNSSRTARGAGGHGCEPVPPPPRCAMTLLRRRRACSRPPAPRQPYSARISGTAQSSGAARRCARGARGRWQSPQELLSERRAGQPEELPIVLPQTEETPRGQKHGGRVWAPSRRSSSVSACDAVGLPQRTSKSHYEHVNNT